MKNQIPGIKFFKANHAGVMELKDNVTVKYAFIKIEDNKAIYFTKTGMDKLTDFDVNEIFKKNANNFYKTNKIEDNLKDLIELGYIAITQLDQIKKVLS